MRSKLMVALGVLLAPLLAIADTDSFVTAISGVGGEGASKVWTAAEAGLVVFGAMLIIFLVIRAFGRVARGK